YHCNTLLQYTDTHKFIPSHPIPSHPIAFCHLIMPLIYTLISRQNTILTEYQIPDIGGNFPQITQTVLKRIAKSPVPPSNNSSNKTTADNIRERLLASTTSQSHHIDIENK